MLFFIFVNWGNFSFDFGDLCLEEFYMDAFFLKRDK